MHLLFHVIGTILDALVSRYVFELKYTYIVHFE